MDSAVKIAGGAFNVLSGGQLIGTETFSGTGGVLAVGNTAGVALSISGFAQRDELQLTNFAFQKTETLKFVEAGNNKSGTLTITDGALKATITLFGQYLAGGFELASNQGVGTTLTYVSSTAAHADVLAKMG